jgi:NADH-quinone oxidoreductase subunit H
MLVTLFLGGWTLPVFGLDRPASSVVVGLVHIGVFLAKVLAVMFMVIWVRWMWPRFRYDQLMALGWRRFLPLALANIVATAGWLWLQA